MTNSDLPAEAANIDQRYAHVTAALDSILFAVDNSPHTEPRQLWLDACTLIRNGSKRTGHDVQDQLDHVIEILGVAATRLVHRSPAYRHRRP